MRYFICCVLFFSFVSYSFVSDEGPHYVLKKGGATIHPLKSKPQSHYAFYTGEPLDFRFYFDRDEWAKKLELHSKDQELKKEYLHTLDSLQQLHGIIKTQELNSYSSGWHIINTGPVTDDIFLRLLCEGKVFIQYNDGVAVQKIITKKRNYARGYSIQFYDVKKKKDQLHQEWYSTGGHF